MITAANYLLFVEKLLSKTLVFLFFFMQGERENHFEALNTSTTLKRKVIETFHKETLFYLNEKYLILHSGDVNLCQYIVSVLRDKD